MSHRIDGPERAAASLILAHGAGADMDTPFLEAMADGMAAREIRVIRFEFPYMQRRRASGKRLPPDRSPVLLDAYREVVARYREERSLFIGGKSMGGRIASMLADELAPAGLICFGYPFHPPGKPERPRVAHLRTLVTPALIVQGTRDPFGCPDEVAGYRLSDAIEVTWLEDGDHGFRPRKSSGLSEAEHWQTACARAAEFIHRRSNIA